MSVLDRLGLSLPIVQAPMAGVSTPDLAAAVSNAGGLGSPGLGATDAAGTHGSARRVDVVLFFHRAARADPARGTARLDALALLSGASPPPPDPSDRSAEASTTT